MNFVFLSYTYTIIIINIIHVFIHFYSLNIYRCFIIVSWWFICLNFFFKFISKLYIYIRIRSFCILHTYIHRSWLMDRSDTTWKQRLCGSKNVWCVCVFLKFFRHNLAIYCRIHCMCIFILFIIFFFSILEFWNTNEWIVIGIKILASLSNNRENNGDYDYIPFDDDRAM